MLMHSVWNLSSSLIPRSVSAAMVLSLIGDQELIPLVVTTNRAPVLTAWVYTVAGRLGFDKQESLSLGELCHLQADE